MDSSYIVTIKPEWSYSRGVFMVLLNFRSTSALMIDVLSQFAGIYYGGT
jgi:hypothetical protein